MTYEEFIDFVPAKCMYETIYKDSEGRLILVIDMLSAYGMLNKAKRTWVGLTEKEVEDYWDWEDFQCGAGRGTILEMVRDIEAKLKEKNT
jgi:hypothetical protein